jgi:hypothetical protein
MHLRSFFSFFKRKCCIPDILAFNSAGQRNGEEAKNTGKKSPKPAEDCLFSYFLLTPLPAIPVHKPIS